MTGHTGAVDVECLSRMHLSLGLIFIRLNSRGQVVHSSQVSLPSIGLVINQADLAKTLGAKTQGHLEATQSGLVCDGSRLV